MQITRIGDGLAVILPPELVEQLGLKEGDTVELRAAADRTVEVEKSSDRLELLKSLRKYRGSLPADYKFDRDEANERRPDVKD